MRRIAIIDLGTNTFHILIAKIEGSSFQKLLHKRFYTKLGEEGVETIGLKPFQRGLEALQVFHSLIQDYNVQNVKVLGTAALRKASNGAAFIKEVKRRFDLVIDVIDGTKEADYIYKGVMLSLPEAKTSSIIMDIGGGSVEFIISQNEEIKFIKSFPVGLSPLHHVADISNCANPDDVVKLHQWLVGQLESLYQAIEKYQPRQLIGSAGAFEVLVEMTGQQLETGNVFEIEKSLIRELYPKVLGSTRSEKHEMEGLPEERIDYISAAFVLIWHIIDAVDPAQILVSRYALKEGALVDFLD